jgi:hypothetical protein
VFGIGGGTFREGFNLTPFGDFPETTAEPCYWMMDCGWNVGF